MPAGTSTAMSNAPVVWLNQVAARRPLPSARCSARRSVDVAAHVNDWAAAFGVTVTPEGSD